MLVDDAGDSKAGSKLEKSQASASRRRAPQKENKVFILGFLLTPKKEDDDVRNISKYKEQRKNNKINNLD